MAACSAQPKTAICASTAASSGIKEVIFYEARQRFRGDKKYIDDLHRDLLVAVASPTTTNSTDCRGTLTINIPAAYRDSFHQKAALTADINYSAQSAGEGGGGYMVSGYDPVLTQILDAANTLQSPSAATTDAKPAPTIAPISPPSGAVASEPAAEAPGERAWYVTGLDPNGDNWLALKAGPDIGAARLAKLGPGTILRSDGRRSGPWLAVRTDDGVSGWVAARYVACCRN